MKKDLSPGELAYIATGIAVELSKGQTVEEINIMRTIASHIACTFSTIICEKVHLDNQNNKKNR